VHGEAGYVFASNAAILRLLSGVGSGGHEVLRVCMETLVLQSTVQGRDGKNSV
jgi:hypothetical protein